MIFQKSDVGVALMACVLLGCPKKAGSDASRDGESSSSEMLPAERENEAAAGGNTVWISNIDDQSQIGDELDDTEGDYSGDLLAVSTAVDQVGSTLFVAGSYGGVGYQSVIYGFVGRLDPMTGELGWIVGLDSDVTGVAAALDGRAVYVTTIYDCLAFDADGVELWRVPMLSGSALSAGVAGDVFLAGSTLFTSVTGTPGSGIVGARDWIVARVRQSDGGLL